MRECIEISDRGRRILVSSDRSKRDVEPLDDDSLDAPDREGILRDLVGETA